MTMTMKLKLYVCTNFVADYTEVIKNEGFEEVTVAPFPCYCTNRKLERASFLFNGDDDHYTQKMLICGHFCPILRQVNLESIIHQTQIMNYCFNHLVNEHLIDYILERGGYIVTNGWLRNWRTHLENEGFDQVIAQNYYKEFCRELVLLDTKIDKNSETQIQELAEYLQLPYKILNVGLENLSIYIRSLVFEWRLTQKRSEESNVLNDYRRQTAEYSAVLKIIEQIAVYTRKRDIVEKLKEIFEVVFGACYIRYIDIVGNSEYIETHYKALLEHPFQVHEVDREKNRMIIKLQHGDEFYGILEAGDFLFPEYLKNYVSFAISIVGVCGLGFSNASKYELLEKSKDEITFNSFHDSLTNLYNRNYYNQYLKDEAMAIGTGVIMADVDGLKKVNDTLGHLYGDELITLAAKALKESFRETDIIARIGGDEFIVIVFESSEDILVEGKDRIQNIISRLNSETPDRPFSLSLSIGVALKVDSDDNWESVIHEADQRMYEDKVFKKRIKDQS